MKIFVENGDKLAKRANVLVVAACEKERFFSSNESRLERAPIARILGVLLFPHLPNFRSQTRKLARRLFFLL